MAVPEDLVYLNAEIESVRNALIDARERLRNANPSWAEDDARLTVFNKCSNVTGSVMLGFVFMDHHLTKPQWWAEKARYGATPQAIQNSCNEFNMFLRIAFIQFLFFAVESSFRVFVRALDSTACNQGCDDFKNVYEWLLRRLNVPRFLPLLDLVRNVRNVMHNNGLFFPKSMKNATVVHGGRSYVFEVGRANAFVSWQFVFDLSPELVEMLEAVAGSPELVKVSRIAEPS